LRRGSKKAIPLRSWRNALRKIDASDFLSIMRAGEWSPSSQESIDSKARDADRLRTADAVLISVEHTTGGPFQQEWRSRREPGTDVVPGLMGLVDM